MTLAKDFKVKSIRFIIGLIVLIVLSVILDKSLFNNKSYHWLIQFGLGGFLMLLGLALPAISGRQLKLSGRSNKKNLPRGTTDKLVTSGLYTKLRHPAFQGFWFLLFGIGLLLNSYSFVFILAPLASAYIFYFALVQEEQEAFDRFGCDYEFYRQTVPAFLPSFLFRWTKKPKFNCHSNQESTHHHNVDERY